MKEMSQEIVDVRNLKVNIGKKAVLDDISVRFQKGEAVVIAGSNGCGKSTLLRSLAGIVLPDKGSIEYSRDIDQRKIGFISDQISLFENFTVKQGINFHSSVFQIKDFDDTLIGELKLSLKQKIKSLSAGERTLYHLALVLSQKPEVLLIDEIIHTIDPYLREKFLEAVIDLMERCRTTVVMVNHTFSEIEKIPERVLIMEKGRFIVDEKVEALGEKLKKVVTASEIAKEIPCIFKRESSFLKEYFIYPFSEEVRTKFAYDYKNTSLNEMIKAFIGGQYVQKGML
jgi:ABC-type multidrug transport system ATPase subunit